MLLKRLIFIFTLFISSSVFSSKITYEDFIHMNKSQKIQTIRLIHKFLNEYETQSYILRTKKSKKYSEYKKILDYFISSAYASDISTNQTYRDNRCFYAGWISITKIDKDNNPFCIHPRRLGYGDNIDLVRNNTAIEEIASYYKKTLAPKYKPYFKNKQPGSAKAMLINLDEKGEVTGFSLDTNNCSDGENIACNPEVYGQSKGGESLCVKSEGNNGVNASFICDKAMNYLKENDKNKFNEHMEHVINLMLSDENSTPADLLETMFDTCLCEGSRGLINESYASELFGTRTCAGILSQSNNITQTLISSCKEKSESLQNLDADLLNFIIKANKVINDDIDNIRTLPFTSKDNTQATRDIVVALKKKDKEKVYKELSEQHRDKAKHLCEVKDDSETVVPPEQGEPDKSSSINVSFSGYTYNSGILYSKLTPTIILNNNEVSKKDRKPIIYIPSLTEIMRNTPGLEYVTVTPKNKTTYTYSYTHEGQDIAGKGLELSPPKISCELNLLEDKKMIEIIPNTSEIEGFDLNNHLNKVSVDLKSDDKKIESEQENENPLILKLKELDSTKSYTANGSIKLKSINLSFSCQNEVASSPPEEKEELIKSCKLKLKREVDQNGGYKVSASMEYFKDKEGKEQIDPTKEDHKETFSNFKTSLTWFDLGFPANKKKKEEKKQDKTENTADVLDLSDESEKKEEEKEEKKKKSAFELLGEKYHTYKGKNGKEWRGTSLRNVPPQAADRKVGAYIKFSGDGVPKACKDQYQSIMIPAFGASNNSPVQQNLINTNIERPRGGMPFQMQR